MKTIAAVGRAVTIDGKTWAFRMTFPSGHWEQWLPDMRNMRAKWYGDTMQYYNPIER